MDGRPIPKFLGASDYLGTLCQWFKGPKCAIYSCHFLASWTSRMWSFAMALFMASIPEASMRISATYGLSRGAAMLLLGAFIGDWVDRTARLKAALLTMIGHNTLVIVCCLIILTLHTVQHKMGDLDTWVLYLVYAVIMVLSVSSRLMKEGRIIVIERDWIAEMCQNDEHSLAVMTSSFRRIDLSTKILAPIVTGQTMAFAGTVVACVAMAVWSSLSLGVEYLLTRRAYIVVPALHRKQNCSRLYNKVNASKVSGEESEFFRENTDSSMEMSEVSNGNMKSRNKNSSSCWLKVFARFDAVYKGCRKYFSYDVMYAGLALAFLYMTVLGFDEVTINYATGQHLSESVLGLLMGAGSAFGILATLTYPLIVDRLGLPGTGVLGLGLQVTSLFLCVISIWLPGSPFDPFNTRVLQTNSSAIDVGHNATLSFDLSSDASQNSSYTNGLLHHTKNDSSTLSNLTFIPTLESGPDVSIWVMMAGVVLARFGLWTADLTIIQLFLENVQPNQRGLVNGFQDSLNQLMDFVKYGLVHIVPHNHQFGLLVIISVGFIYVAWVLMCVYAVKARRKAVKTKNNKIICNDSV